jgi:hypothetical protein
MYCTSTKELQKHAAKSYTFGFMIGKMLNPNHLSCDYDIIHLSLSHLCSHACVPWIAKKIERALS